MTLRTLVYACGCRTIGRFAAPATAWEAHAYCIVRLCPLCEASHAYRDAMAHRERAERATREVLAAQEQEQSA